MIKIVKKVIITTAYFILIFLILTGIYLLMAFVLSRIEIKAEPISTKDVAIYIITNGVHTDIVVPVKNSQIDWSREIKYTDIAIPDTTYKYIAMGFGNKKFYIETPTWADLKFSTAFNSIFGLGPSAIHATFYRYLNKSNTCKKIYLSKKQYSRLINYIQRSFKKDTDGHFFKIKTDKCYGDNDAFYEADIRFYFFRTCNTWANNGLKASGQKACLWTPFDKGIFYHYKDQK